jgi:hypothetical protein
VFAELHAVTVRNAIGFAGAWELLTRPDTCVTRNDMRRWHMPCSTSLPGGDEC